LIKLLFWLYKLAFPPASNLHHGGGPTVYVLFLWCAKAELKIRQGCAENYHR